MGELWSSGGLEYTFKFVADISNVSAEKSIKKRAIIVKKILYFDCSLCGESIIFSHIIQTPLCSALCGSKAAIRFTVTDCWGRYSNLPTLFPLHHPRPKCSCVSTPVPFGQAQAPGVCSSFFFSKHNRINVLVLMLWFDFGVEITPPLLLLLCSQCGNWTTGPSQTGSHFVDTEIRGVKASGHPSLWFWCPFSWWTKNYYIILLLYVLSHISILGRGKATIWPAVVLSRTAISS